MNKLLLLYSIVFMVACAESTEHNTEEATDTDTTITDTVVVEAEMIDSTVLLTAFEGTADIEFEMNYLGEPHTFQLTAEFYDDETHPQSVLTLYTGSVNRGVLPTHPAGYGFISAKNEQDFPHKIADFNGDGKDDLLLTIRAFMVDFRETQDKVGVPSIYFQTDDGKFVQDSEVDFKLREEMSMDEIKSLCKDVDANAL
ncbi:hypothetical protein K6119_04175 [Paracrocinitomix mangrovi]|uniref:hypothetical protein n=1 Tax=Paracrocinitomix mangrovi TaxID=2862509 RepID=UPI001C8CFA27|nr:hypothetical protein [Paracrocinitomix mangrovi]UKN02710.1 hypothetical protein K6119_04175 [Paracrocinitomix mangrovi]